MQHGIFLKGEVRLKETEKCTAHSLSIIAVFKETLLMSNYLTVSLISNQCKLIEIAIPIVCNKQVHRYHFFPPLNSQHFCLSWHYQVLSGLSLCSFFTPRYVSVRVMLADTYLDRAEPPLSVERVHACEVITSNRSKAVGTLFMHC